MPASISILGIDPLTNRVRTWPKAISDAVLQQVLVEARPLVSHMRSRAASVGGSARIAGRTVALVASRDGVSVTAGGTPVLFGAEFGSKRGGRRRAYVTRSRKGTPYVVRRRTKLQFPPFLGSRGYWFWPTVRTDLKGINRRVGAILAEAVK
jgi:hypothetical protein